MSRFLATDIDGTLMSPYRNNNDEYIKTSDTRWGKSFMRKSNLDLLMELQDLIPVIPVTTRSRKSYFSLMEVSFPVAAIENGAILMVNGGVDADWERTSEKMYSSVMRQQRDNIFNKMSMRGYLIKNETRYVIDLIKPSGSCDEDYDYMTEIAYLYDVYRGGTKGLYAIPKCFDKSVAVRRLCNMLKKRAITAGDSAADWKMLLLNESYGLSNGPAVHRFDLSRYEKDNHTFCEYFLNEIQNIVAK